MAREIKSYFRYSAKKDFAEGGVFEGHSKRVAVHDEKEDYRSYIESDIKIAVDTNGALSFIDCESINDPIVYFYPDQLIHLKEALDIAMEQNEKRTNIQRKIEVDEGLLGKRCG